MVGEEDRGGGEQETAEDDSGAIARTEG